MAFFSSTKTLGIIFEIVGAFIALEGVLMIALGVMAQLGMIDTDLPLMLFLIEGAGSLIAGVIYIVYADKVARGRFDRKVDVLAGYVKMVGVTTLIVWLATAAAEYLYVDQSEEMLIGAAVVSVIAILVIILGTRINNGKKGLGKKVLYVFLIIVFIGMMIMSLLEAEDWLTYVDHILHLIVAVFLVLLMFDNEVKMDMGII
jgi:hypothetical protein